MVGILLLIFAYSVVEVLLSQACTESLSTVETLVAVFLESLCSNYSNGYVDFSNDSRLNSNVIFIKICDIENVNGFVSFWNADLKIHVYTQNKEGSTPEVIEGTGDVTAFSEWMLPCCEFDDLWDQYVCVFQ